MRMTINDDLCEALIAFGFDDRESKIYLAGLAIGSGTVLEFAKQANLPRTTIYPIIENLQRRGYFQLRIEKGHTHYVAEPPSTFLKRLEEREEKFKELLPSLEALRGTTHDNIGVTMYEGSDGFRQFWQKLFRSGVKEYCLLTSAVGLREYVHEDYLIKHIIASRIKLGIKSRQLIPENLITKKIVANDQKELRESRFLPTNISLPATMLIFGNEVAFVTTRKENSVILVASGDIAATLHATFELLWLTAKQTT